MHRFALILPDAEAEAEVEPDVAGSGSHFSLVLTSAAACRLFSLRILAGGGGGGEADAAAAFTWTSGCSCCGGGRLGPRLWACAFPPNFSAAKLFVFFFLLLLPFSPLGFLGWWGGGARICCKSVAAPGSQGLMGAEAAAAAAGGVASRLGERERTSKACVTASLSAASLSKRSTSSAALSRSRSDRSCSLRLTPLSLRAMAASTNSSTFSASSSSKPMAPLLRNLTTLRMARCEIPFTLMFRVVLAATEGRWRGEGTRPSWLSSPTDTLSLAKAAAEARALCLVRACLKTLLPAARTSWLAATTPPSHLMRTSQNMLSSPDTRLFSCPWNVARSRLNAVVDDKDIAFPLPAQNQSQKPGSKKATFPARTHG